MCRASPTAFFRKIRIASSRSLSVKKKLCSPRYNASKATDEGRFAFTEGQWSIADARLFSYLAHQLKRQGFDDFHIIEFANVQSLALLNQHLRVYFG